MDDFHTSIDTYVLQGVDNPIFWKSQEGAYAQGCQGIVHVEQAGNSQTDIHVQVPCDIKLRAHKIRPGHIPDV